MTRAALALALLLAGCPAQQLSTEHVADCCIPEDAGDGCRWTTTRYSVPRFTEPLASEERACRSAGLLPYEAQR